MQISSLMTQHRRHLEVTSHNSSTVTMRLDNFFDVQYTGKLQIGGQVLDAVVDTGSFELLVLSKECYSCGESQQLYDPSNSPTYTASDLQTQHNFGSGTTSSKAATDHVRIGGVDGIEIESQAFWQVTDAKMGIMSDNSFQAILGVGPPDTAAKFAQDQLLQATSHRVHNHMTKDTGLIEDDSVNNLHAVVEHAWMTPSVVGNIGLGTMSVCLHKEAKRSGVMIWNDRAPKEQPEKFTKVPVIGDTYWSATLTNAAFGGGHGRDVQLGCFGAGRCSAVLDTGTSLIVAPRPVGIQVDKIVQAWKEKGGTCDDLSGLPNLEFQLDGHLFSLPPESYVGTVSGWALDEVNEMMPQLRNSDLANGTADVGLVSCKSLIMTEDIDSQKGPVWILGQPFFRKYYTSFHFTTGPRLPGHNSIHPVASFMAFSEADANCQPSMAPGASNGRLTRGLPATSQLLGLKVRADSRLHLNASRIRMPTVVRKARAKASALGSQLLAVTVGSSQKRVKSFAHI